MGRSTVSSKNPRARGDRQRRVLALTVLGLVVVLSLTWSLQAAPDVRTEPREVVLYDADLRVQYTYLLPVTGNSTTYEGSPVAGMGYAGYFDRVTPVVRVTYEFEPESDQNATGTVDLTTTLRLTAIDARNRPFWAIEETLVDERSVELGDDGMVRRTFDVNVTALRGRVAQVENETGLRVSDVHALAITTAEYNLTLNQHEVNGTHVHQFPIQLHNGYFALEGRDELGAVQSVRNLDVRTVATAMGPKEALLANPAVLIVPALSMIALAGLVARWYWPGQDDVVLSTATRRTRMRYKAWFTQASVPAAWADNEQVRVMSLRDLVDIAIDARTRVLEDADAGRYYVRTDDALHVFEDEDADATAGRPAVPAV